MNRIPSVRDARSTRRFVRWCVARIGLAYHPDTPFGDYSDSSGHPLFSPAEAEKLDQLSDSAFALCGDAVYRMGMQEFSRLRRFL
jgi:hypothetical protein